MSTKKANIKNFVEEKLNKSIDDLSQKLLVFNLALQTTPNDTVGEQKESETGQRLTRELYDQLDNYRKTINQGV